MRAARVLLLVVVVCAMPLAGQERGAGPPYVGRTLVDVLQDLNRIGLRIVFSTSLVPPTLRVSTEPAGTAREVLDQVLRPHGLYARPGAQGLLIVARLPRRRDEATPAPAPAAAAAPSAPDKPQIFRTGVNTVPVYATVTDARGVLIPNLAISDFQIDDDGRRQAITFFKGDVQPITIAILVDASPSLFDVALRLQKAVTEFVGQLRPDDRACLGIFSHVVTLNPALTGDHDVLMRRLGDDAPFPAGTALWDAIEAGRAAVTGEGGRRVVLVVTDAADNSSVADIDALRTRVQREGVMVYGVGVRGLEGLQTRELSAIARSTGGWYFELKPADDVGAAMRRIADELHQQYVLGFSPRTLDDRVHRIDVKIARPGLTVRAQRSYFASAHADAR